MQVWKKSSDYEFNASVFDTSSILLGAKIALILLTLFFLGKASSQGLEVAPVLIELAARDRAEQVVLKNRTSKAMSFGLSMQLWSQRDGEDVLTATEVFVVSPPAVTLKPGETRTIRLLRTEPPDDVMESSYRLILEEIPLKENKVPGRPTLTLVLSIPLFAAPLVESAPDFRVALKKDVSKRQQILTVNNLGKIRAQILSAQLLALGKPLNDPLPLIGYALPGQSRSWEISNDQLVGADAIKIALPGGDVRTLPIVQ